MKFDWTNFTEVDFTDYCAKAENNMLSVDEYVGCVRVGNLCFDLMVRTNENDESYLSYDLYVGGVDSGYGYTASDYPYDYAEGGNFEDTMISMTYEEFQTYAEEKFELFIIIWPYEAASLIEKANEPLNIW
jgi:hypothetical protein